MGRRIAHVSDLHFGAADASLVDPLLRSLEEQRPHLVVVSGDLTQRARRSQFEASRDLLARVPAPCLVVPGNHDIPLWNVALRFLAPRRRFVGVLGRPWTPEWSDDELVVVGLDSARPWRWKEGAVSREQLERVARAFASAPSGAFRAVVLHHPLVEAQGLSGRHPLAAGARRARQALRDCGTDLVLTGHLHVSGLRHLVDVERKGLLLLQAPSAISHRLRGELNGYQVVDVEPARVRTTLLSWKAASRRYVPVESHDHGRHGPPAAP